MEAIFSAMYDRFGDVNTKVVEPAVRVNEIAARAQALVAQKNMEVVETSLEAGMQQLRAFGESKNPTELVAAQAELATTVGEKWVAAAREVLDIQLKARDDLHRVFLDSWKLNQPASEAKTVARAPSRTSKKAA